MSGGSLRVQASPSHSSTSISSATSSSRPTTSRQLIQGGEYVLPHTTTSSASLTSRSSADIPSEVLNETPGGLNPNNNEDNKQNTSPSPSIVHGHILPTGWSCKYTATTDEYRFEFQADSGPVNRPSTSNNDPHKDEESPSRQARRADVRKTPTRDDTVQTSRRPTLHLYECRYGYHFPTSPTSSMISQLAKQVQKSSAPGQQAAPKVVKIGYGKHKLVVPSDEDEQVRRLRDMFPTATVPVIEQMIQIYHAREGLIKAALISLGYKRSTEYNVQQASAQSPVMLMMSKPASKRLFDKLVSYFPEKDERLIKNLMYHHKEVEHEIISALVESGPAGGSSDAGHSMPARTRDHLQDGPMLRHDRSGSIMKLRYLKFLYPTCEEIELYHLLNCNDLNAQRVMDLVEKRGHKKANIEEVMQNRKSQTQQMRAQQAAHAAKEKAISSASDLVEAHVKRPKPNVAESRVNSLKANLLKTFENLDERLALGALEAADFNESLARMFIEEMKTVDESLFRQRYQTHVETKPNVIAFPCKGVQKDDTTYMSIEANENVFIDRAVIECENALALLKVDASTFTQDDLEPVKFSHRQGPHAGLAKGPTFRRKYQANLRDSLKVGPKANLRHGTKYEQVCDDETRPKPNTRALGPKETLAKGRNQSLQCGHNAKLLERTHPFFIPAQARG